MAKIIRLPKVPAPPRKEARVVKWLVKEGDSVTSGTQVAEIETDKSNTDFVIEESGVIAKLLIGEDETVALEANALILAEEGEDVDVESLLAEASK